MLIGYVRVSKSDGTQTLEPQRDAMLAAGVDPARIYEDLASGRRDDRLGLAACLKATQPGNTLVLWKPLAKLSDETGPSSMHCWPGPWRAPRSSRRCANGFRRDVEEALADAHRSHAVLRPGPPADRCRLLRDRAPCPGAARYLCRDRGRTPDRADRCHRLGQDDPVAAAADRPRTRRPGDRVALAVGRQGEDHRGAAARGAVLRPDARQGCDHLEPVRAARARSAGAVPAGQEARGAVHR